MTETKTNDTVFLSNTWLDSTSQLKITGNTTSITTMCTSCNSYNCGCNHWYTPSYPWNYCTPNITLKFSEVEYLRKAAKKDAKLKKILKNFGPHIEIEVDF